MKLRQKIRSFFFIKDGEKEVLQTKRIKILSVIIFILLLAVQIFWPKDITSHSKSSTQLLNSNKDNVSGKNSISGNANALIKSHQARFNDDQKKLNKKKSTNTLPIEVNLNATQVLNRESNGASRKALPSGTNFIGQLLGAIDTRNQNQVIKVLLPYGAKHRSGGSIPKNSILLGTVNYSDQGEKVFIQFNRIIFPEGHEFQIDAQALSSSDYSPGLVGIHHGNADLRIAASMGLTMISAAANVLTSRRAISGVNQAGVQELASDPTIKNAMLQGASKVTQQEASRQAGSVNQKQDYITIQAGNDLIVSLLTPFNGKGF